MTEAELDQYCEWVDSLPRGTFHEYCVEDRLIELRRSFHVLTLQPPSEENENGKRVLPKFPCTCGTCAREVQPTQSLLMDEEGRTFCDTCFEEMHIDECQTPVYGDESC
jgi:hypothetical protein